MVESNEGCSNEVDVKDVEGTVYQKEIHIAGQQRCGIVAKFK